MDAMLTYIKKDSPIDKLTGATKLICFIFWTLAAMLTYDTRVLIGMLIFSLIIFKVSKIEFKEVSFIVYFILFFLLLNDLAIFIFSPYEGVNIYGTRHDIFHIVGPYTLTWEQLFYEFNVTLKYLSVIPMALLFILATNPSEFAASLNKIGVSYKISYSVSIAVSYTHLRAHETKANLVCRLLLDKKKHPATKNTLVAAFPVLAPTLHR